MSEPKTKTEQIRISWRGTFQQPKGVLNPLGVRMASPIEVEVRPVAKSWKAYRPGTNAEFKEIAAQPSGSAIKGQVRLLFEKQLVGWQPFDYVTGKALAPNEFALDENEKAWRIKT